MIYSDKQIFPEEQTSHNADLSVEAGKGPDPNSTFRGKDVPILKRINAFIDVLCGL